MKKLILIGAGGHCRSAIDIAESTGKYNSISIIDYQNKEKLNEKILGYDVMSGLDWMDKLDRVSDYFVAVGSAVSRQEIQKILQSRQVTVTSLLHKKAHIHNTAVIGTGVFIGAFAHVGPECRIGDGSIINTHANVEHESTINEFTHCAPRSTVCGRCEIGSYVLLGAGSTVINGIKIADEVTVGAGAVIIKNLLDRNTTNVGVPSRPI